jgi:predicted N-acetyltransferase YhbS
MKGANHLNPCIIRSEQVSDYHAITLINARAFHYSTSMAEAVLVNVLRGSESFDPDLSLVAVWSPIIVMRLRSECWTQAQSFGRLTLMFVDG